MATTSNESGGAIKTWGTIVLIIILILITVGNWLFPRDSKLAEQSINIMNNASFQMNRAAAAIEASSNAQVVLSNNLNKQLDQLTAVREKRYDELVKKYGLSELDDNALGVQPQNNSK